MLRFHTSRVQSNAKTVLQYTNNDLYMSKLIHDKHLQYKHTCTGTKLILSSFSCKQLFISRALHPFPIQLQPAPYNTLTMHRWHRTQLVPSSSSGRSTFLSFTYHCFLPVFLGSLTFATNVLFYPSMLLHL